MLSQTKRACLGLAAASLIGLSSSSAAAEEPTDLLYPGVGPAGGITFYVNPKVPEGYDSARFVAVAQRSIVRWGNTYAGLTDLGPDTSDRVNVIGFDPTLFANAAGMALTSGITNTSPPTTTCTTTQVAVPRTVTVKRRVKERRRIRRKRKGKTVFVTVKKNGKTVYRNGKPVYRYRYVTVTRTFKRQTTVLEDRQSCSSVPGVTTVEKIADVKLSTSKNWQFGPALPTGNQVDFETVLLHELGHVSGLPHAAQPCTDASPMQAFQYANDYWHSPTVFDHTACHAINPGS